MKKIGAIIKPLEIDVNGINLTVYLDDEMMLKIDKVRDELSTFKVEGDNESVIKENREKVIKLYDILFGKGVFKEIEHSLTGTDKEFTIRMTWILGEIITSIDSENSQIPLKYQKNA